MRFQKGWLASVVSAAFLVPALAGAQETRVIIDEEPDAVIQIGGGVSEFTQGLDDVTETGAAWDVRAVFAPKSALGMEAAYFGAMNPLTGDDDAALSSNGGEALLRANFGGDRGDVQPYVAAGLGIVQHRVVNEGNMFDGVTTERFGDSTDILIPAAAGVDVFLADRITVGARLGYKFYFEDEVIADEDATSAQSWAATARLGAAF